MIFGLADTDENIISRHLRSLQKSADGITSYKKSLSENLDRSIAEKQRQVDNISLSLAAGSLDGAALEHINNLLNNMLTELDELKCRRSESVNSKDNGKLAVTDIRSALSYLISHFDEIPIIRRRELIKKVVRKAVWDGENLDIYLVGSSEDDETTAAETVVMPEPVQNEYTVQSEAPDDDDYKDFKENANRVIRQYASSHHIGLRQLAKNCGVSYTALKKWLNGSCCPSRKIYESCFREFYKNTYDKK